MAKKIENYPEVNEFMKGVLRALEGFSPMRGDTLQMTSGSLYGSNWEVEVVIKPIDKAPVVIKAGYAETVTMEPWQDRGDPANFIGNQFKLPERVTHTHAWVEALNLITAGEYPSGFGEIRNALMAALKLQESESGKVSAKSIREAFDNAL